MRHDRREIKSFKRIRDGEWKIWELEYKLREQIHKFEEDKALMKMQAFKDQLDTTNTSFKRGHEVMKKLMARGSSRKIATAP